MAREFIDERLKTSGENGGSKIVEEASDGEGRGAGRWLVR